MRFPGVQLKMKSQFYFQRDKSVINEERDNNTNAKMDQNYKSLSKKAALDSIMATNSDEN